MHFKIESGRLWEENRKRNDRLRKWARKKGKSQRHDNTSMYRASHSYIVRWHLTLYPIWWISPVRPPQRVPFGFFFILLTAHRHTHTWRPAIPANPQHKFTPELLGVIDPGSKRADIGMQLTRTTVWDINTRLSISVCLSLSPSFFFPSLHDPWRRDWLLLRAAHWWWGVMWDSGVSRPATPVTAGETIKI